MSPTPLVVPYFSSLTCGCTTRLEKFKEYTKLPLYIAELLVTGGNS
jgi:hypothetical protein